MKKIILYIYLDYAMKSLTFHHFSIMTRLLPKELIQARELMDQAKLDEEFDIVE